MSTPPTFGWIGPEGQWRPCFSNGHATEAGRICDELLHLEYPYFGETELENRGWIKISAPCSTFWSDYPWMVQYHGKSSPSKQALERLYTFVVYFEKLGKTEDANVLHQHYERLSGR